MLVSQATASAMLALSGTRLNSGTLVIYSGTVPAGPNTALSGNTVLATFTFSASAMGTPTYNSGTGNMEGALSVTATSVAPAASGTATFARAIPSGGGNNEEQLTVGTSGTDIVIGNTSIQTGTDVTWTSGKFTLPCASN